MGRLTFPVSYRELVKRAERSPVFERASDFVRHVSDAIKPPEDLTVTEAAERYRVVYNPGSYVGPWRREITPYIAEYQDTFASVEHTAVIFVGPAQCGKTDASLNWLVHSVLVWPMDLMIVEKTQELAKDFAYRRLAKVHEHSPAMGEAYMSPQSRVFMHKYKTGMFLNVTWPSKNTLSGRPIPHILLSDYDRMPENVDGEGDPFSLARKRTTTFGRQAMTVAESSPSFPITNLDWSPKAKHEAPPTRGILSLYNMGDRRRWYWLCVKCGHSFEPDLRVLKWPDRQSIEEAAAGAHIECPTCGAKYFQEATDGLPGRNQMNREHARWLREGETWTREHGVRGTPRVSDVASFWLKGPAAAFTTLPDLVRELLSAEEEYARTGNEEVLRAVYNTTFGLPYVPKMQQSLRTADSFRRRAKPYPLREVPLDVRFLIATIDVQGNRFEVQVHGVTDAHSGGCDWYVIDRFKVRTSRRVDDKGEPYHVEPHKYFDDWKLLVREVLLKTYPLGDGSGRRMGIRMIGCDSAGMPGVTPHAYQFWRWLMHGPALDEEAEEYGWVPGLTERFILVRGEDGSPLTMMTKPRVKVIFPDSAKHTKYNVARGDVPIAKMNALLLKDEVNAMLLRDEGSRIFLSDELPRWFFSELAAEVRDDRKGWITLHHRRNEAFDLLYYARGLSLLPTINLDMIDWSNPPDWAEEWDANSMVISGEGDLASRQKQEYGPSDRASLGEILA